MPQVAVMALLPAAPQWADVGPTNEQYAALAERQGVPFIRCGQELDPTDASLFRDGLHPNGRGQARLMQCLRAKLAPYLFPGAPANLKPQMAR